ncbi:hypothetical protein C8F04DRAFT_1399249 [Mycena alexandri]|uniref:Uncharacterized protein n=1 Tax=Mycena alexandri TaxID=1745969 RepID=A0AAD6WYB4_9AGAR|nr:hypothetical protein C8F04DRAFT_1399249 [Mycena alexandri]
MAFQDTRHADSVSLADYSTGWNCAAPVKNVPIVPSEELFELPLPLPLNYTATEKLDIEEQGETAMRIAALLVQDDLAVMVEGSNGAYYFQGGAICSRPDEEKLHTSLARFFRRLAVDKLVVRNNYFVRVSPPSLATPSVDPDELAWGENVLGPEDDYGGTKGSSFESPPVLVVTPQTLRHRTERQTLRRLPRSGAIVFTIRTYLVPVEELAREPGVAARFASAVRSWPDGVKEYKGERRYHCVPGPPRLSLSARRPKQTHTELRPAQLNFVQLCLHPAELSQRRKARNAVYGDVLVQYLEEMAEREEGGTAAKPYPF